MTISLDKLRNVKRIISHINCPDGMASAMILKQVLPDAEVVFAQYDTPEHRNIKPEPGLLFCDFSPYLPKIEVNGEKVADLSALQPFIEAGTLVFDHHKTAKPACTPFVDLGLGVFGDEVENPGVCGAVLAFNEVFAPLTMATQKSGLSTWNTVKELATLAGIRDTWQRQDPRWDEACAQGEALTFYPSEDLLKVSVGEWASYLRLGPVLIRKHKEHVKKCIEGAYKFTAHAPGPDVRVVMFQGLKPTSDAADVLGDTADLVLGWAYSCEGDNRKIQVSSRSRSDIDVSKLAKKFGGGGHTKAAGFSLPITTSDLNPWTFLEYLISDYLTELRAPSSASSSESVAAPEGSR